jgi:hypothetical protein
MHPEWASAVRQQNFEVGKVDSHIVYVNGITILVPRAGKDRSSGVKHDRNAIGLGRAVNDFKFLHPAEVIIGIEKLVRRMNFDHADPKPQQLLDIGKYVVRVSRVETPARHQALGIFFRIVGDKLVDLSGEPDDLGSHVVDEDGSVNSALVEVLQKSFGRAAEFGDLIEVATLLLHQLQRVRLEKFQGLNVNVAVGNQKVSFALVVSREIR